MHILFLSAWYPYPANNGSKLRIYNLLCGLAQAHEVTLVSFTDRPEVDTAHLETFCKAVYPVMWYEAAPEGLAKWTTFFRPTPSSFINSFSQEMASMIEQIAAADPIDVVISSQIKTAGYKQFAGNVPAIFEEIELGVMYEQYSEAPSTAARLRYGLTWLKHRHYVREVMKEHQLCTVVSAQEKQLVQELLQLQQPIEVIPNGVDVHSYERFHAPSTPNTLIYTGSFGFSANYEAMVWFVGEVLPLVQKEIPDVTLKITGDHKNLPLPENSAVTLTGFVDDIRPLVAQSTISLAPILTGGGTRLKILEAMAMKTAVVATSKGAEGLAVQDHQHILIADSAAAFASAVVELLNTPALQDKMTDNAYTLVLENYDWQILLPRLTNLIGKITGK